MAPPHPSIDLDLIPQDVLDVCRRLVQAGHQAHLVGGGVRDLLLGREPADFDVATNALPDAVLKLFGARYAIPTGLQHGTVTVLAGRPARHVEVTTFRGEGEYLDGRRPSSVSFSATLEEDLARRDFTMNAIAFDPLASAITDPFDGRGDLSRKLVKAVGDPIKRFTEDGLRPMRAVRQATQLGFRIEDATLAAIPRTLASFRMVSGERIRDELFKMLRASSPSTGVRIMEHTRLLAEVLPELQACVGLAQDPPHEMDVFEHSLAVMDLLPPRPDLRLAGLLHDVGKAAMRIAPAASDHATIGAALLARVAERLRLSVAERRLLQDLTAQHHVPYEASWSDAQVRTLLRSWRHGADRIDDLVSLHVANRRARTLCRQEPVEALAFEARVRALLAEAPPLSARELAVDGQTLMSELGIRPGKTVGALLEALLDAVVEDPGRNTRETLVALARQRLEAQAERDGSG